VRSSLAKSDNRTCSGLVLNLSGKRAYQDLRISSGLPVIQVQSQADKADYVPTGRLHITGSDQTLMPH
jgi:hypothetical protein